MKRLTIVLLFAIILMAACKKGDSTSNQPSYSNVKILTAKVINLPFTNSSGSSWDYTSGPDVFFAINDQSGVTLRTSSIINDVIPSSLPLTWTFTQAFQITNLLTQFSINFYDYDSPDPNDAMGSIYFMMDSYKSGYPTTISLSNGSITVELTVQWY